MVKIIAFYPKTLFKDKTVVDSIALVMRRKSAIEVKSMFRRSTYGWKAENKPVWGQKLTKRASYMSMKIKTTSNYDVYSMVNYGTRPHEITPKGSGLLSFKWGGKGSYLASTTPGSIMSKRAYKTGPVRTFLKVDHPGIKDPRRFDETIKEQYEPTFIKDMRDAVQAAASAEMARANRESNAMRNSG